MPAKLKPAFNYKRLALSWLDGYEMKANSEYLIYQ